MYQHLTFDGDRIALPVGKIVCVGLNYQDHVKEMNSILNDDAVLFMKPATAFCHLADPIALPREQGECHNEAEIAILIGQRLSNAREQQAHAAIAGVGIALDLTLREVQQQLKALGRPWERAKAFDGAAPVSGFLPAQDFDDLQDIHFSLTVNGQLRQQGHSKLMIRSITSLLALISAHFTLLPGDVVLTGTPAGVGPLLPGDKLTLTLNDHGIYTEVSNEGAADER